MYEQFVLRVLFYPLLNVVGSIEPWHQMLDLVHLCAAIHH